jgi:hypothetical protein
VLRLPDDRAERLKVRSMIGLLPLCAATVFEGQVAAKYPEMGERFRWFLASRPEIRAAVHDPSKPGVAGRRLASILDETKLRRLIGSVRLDRDHGQVFLRPGVRQRQED